MKAARHPFLEWEGPIPFAHRGGASEAPENTMPAFEYAVNLGYRYIETDVQVTADGVLVAFHDDELHRTTGRAGKISELPWSEVSTALVDGKAPVPMLEDLLGTWPELRVNIDCKSDEAVSALVSAVRRTSSLDRVLVGSFSELRVRRLRAALGPGLCTALGTVAVAGLRFLRISTTKAMAAQVPVRHRRVVVTSRTFVERAHLAGLHVHVWTIDDAAEMNRLLDMGVDGLMTDKPLILREVLQSRDQWFSG